MKDGLAAMHRALIQFMLNLSNILSEFLDLMLLSLKQAKTESLEKGGKISIETQSSPDFVTFSSEDGSIKTWLFNGVKFNSIELEISH